MATYTNLKQILQNFENIVVKGNHYTKAQSDEKYQLKDNALNALANVVKRGSTGAIVINNNESSADNYELVVRDFATKDYTDNKYNEVKTYVGTEDAKVKTYADNTFQLKNEHLTAIANLIGRGNGGVIEIVSGDTSSTPYLKVTSGLATESYVSAKISEVIGGAPAALDTLKELSAALNNDANFASTVTNQLTNINNSLGNYQTKNETLTSLINRISGTTSGIIKVVVGDSSAPNSIIIDNTEYLPKSAFSITDAELLAMVD